MGELRSAIEAEAAVDPGLLDNVTLGASIVALIGARDRLSAVLVRRLAVHDQRLSWKADGVHSQKEWLADRARMTRGEAGTATDTARRLAQLPRTMTALTDGAITSAQAQAAAKAVRDLPPDAVHGLDTLVAKQGPTPTPASCARPWMTTRIGRRRRVWSSGRSERTGCGGCGSRRPPTPRSWWRGGWTCWAGRRC